MTRKDYKLIAGAVNKALDRVEHIHQADWIIEEVVHRLGAVLYQDNPRFKYEKFYAACGLGE